MRMTTLSSPQKTLAQIVENQVLNQHQVDELYQSLDPTSPTFADACFTKSREKGWLSRWQTDQLALGRVDSLRLGEFLLTDFLYRGRTARIFKAKSVVDGRLVLLKVLTSQGQADSNVVNRLQHELDACNHIKSPFVVRCNAVEVFQGRQTLVREWVDGLSVRQIIQQQGKFDRTKIESVIIDLAKGLAAIHDAGMRHGEVHPRHVILKPDLTPVWIDLGFSHLIGSGQPQYGSCTPTSDFERATHARPGDPATDAYFFGCLLYEMLAGGSPHPEIDDDLRLKSSMLRTYGSEIPLSSISDPPKPEIKRTVARMMDVHADRRLSNPHEIVAAFQRIEQGKTPEVGEFDGSDDSLDTAELHRWLSGGGLSPESVQKAERKSTSTEAKKDDASITSTANVICVECQEEIQVEFRKTFDKLGWRARLVRTPETALDMVRERAPDLIVYDADGLGEGALETFLELDRLASMGRRAPHGLLLLGPKQRKLQEMISDSVRKRYQILQKPLKMRDVKTSLLSCAMNG